MPPTYRNHACRLSEYSVQGLRVLFLENELLRVGVLLDKGADIFQFLHKPSDTEFMLHTPRGLRPPAVQSIASNWGSFLDYYQGGWQEILPNGGPACTYKGIEFGLHGEVSTVPWYGQVYTLALEPWSSYPSAGLLAAIDNGTAAAIAPGETRQAWLRAAAYQGLTAVSGVSPAGGVTGGRADGSGG